MIKAALRLALPALLAVALFGVAIFVVTIPFLERSIMDQKRAMIRELTNSAANILARAEYEERSGLLTREEAQQQAIRQIQGLHYGQQGKDYFWINDMQPRMILHPYRSDLNGKDLSTFTDPNGKRLFVEMVATVRAGGAGYVDYWWQWKDDPTRIAPKLSYVKGFEPWGWIIGTGVYIDDVQQEIGSLTRRLATVALGILAAICGLLAYLVWGSLRTERERRRTESALKDSEEKYRLLVESAGESILMALGGDQLYANQSALALLGYDPVELGRLGLDEILVPTEDERERGVRYHRSLLAGEDGPRRYEAQLQARGGELVDVALSISRLSVGERSGIILVASDIRRRRNRELDLERLIDELQTTLLFLNRPVAEACSQTATCPPGATLGQALEVMAPGRLPVVLIEDGHDGPAYLTARAALAALAERKAELAAPAAALARRPLVAVPSDAMLFEALLAMEQADEDHVFVVRPDGRVLGQLTGRDLVRIQSYSPAALMHEVRTAAEPRAVIRASRRLPEIIRTMVRNGARARHVNRLITLNADAALERLVEFALAELGPAPAPFTFMIMGSEGRREQTLRTDQDNAIVYRDVAPEAEPAANAYFLQLGTLVCDWLNEAGYAYCTGEVMAKNPKWVQPLSRWRDYYLDWVRTLEAQDLLHSKIFFDFRCGYGEPALVDELRSAIDAVLDENPRFFFLLARNVLQYGPPLGLFGNLVVETVEAARKAFDIKSAMLPIVDFARIYAFRHGIRLTNTSERLEELGRREVLPRRNLDEILQAYGFLMQMRIENQIQALEAKRPPDNLVEPKNLTLVQVRMLKEVFGQIKNFQVRLSYDFTGMAPGSA